MARIGKYRSAGSSPEQLEANDRAAKQRLEDHYDEVWRLNRWTRRDDAHRENDENRYRSASEDRYRAFLGDC